MTGSPWRQLNLTCDDWRAAEHAAGTALAPLISGGLAAGTISSWWFTRKGGTWRIRIQCPPGGFTEQAAACLRQADGVRAVTEAIYEPETTAFGGPDAMDAAHRLFSADSSCLLTRIATGSPGLHRELPVILASRMLRAAWQDWYEQGDCWDQLASHRGNSNRATPSAAILDAMLTLLTAVADTPASPLHDWPDWGSAFDKIGRKLAELASRGTLTRGLRAVLTHHLLFLFNRHGVSAADQHLLATAARQVIFGPPGAQPGDTQRMPGGAAPAAATVRAVTMTASLSDQDRAAQLRDALADYIKSWGTFRTPQVEAAFRTVSRHLFLPGASLEEAYSRNPVVTRRAPDGTSLSSASSPKLVATMLEQLAAGPGQRVLEIGAATGFNAALIAFLTGPAGQVVTIELDDDLAAEAAANLRSAGYPDVQVLCGDGALGHPAQAPYDRIIVTAEAWDIAAAWWDQLAPDGIIVVPVRLHSSGLTRAISFRRTSTGTLISTSAAVCGFVPMRGIGAHADQRIQLAPDAILNVGTTDQPDAPALTQALTHPAAQYWTGIPVRHDEPAEHLDLWLATTTTEASFSRLSVTAQARDRGFASPAMRWAGASLYQGGTLAYITTRTADDDTDELGITAHGPAAPALADVTLGLLTRWDRQRPAQPAITAHRTPSPPGNAAPPCATRLSRPCTTFTITW
jgi:protein-L-isoaspartate(D-aspartate) O-methyltransferase